MKVQDILHNSSVDVNGNIFQYSNGDFLTGYSDLQHMEDLIRSYSGFWKQNPSVGVGIEDYVNSTGEEKTIEAVTKKTLETDGYTVDKCDYSTQNFGFDIEAERTTN